MKLSELQAAVSSDLLQNQLELLYGAEHVKAQKKRYLKLISRAMELYGDREADLFSAPGRTEVGGNHTDHQLGRVLAASIDLDAAAVVIPEEKPVITYYSDAFEVKPVDLEDLSRKAEEVNTTESLIRGIAARYHELGYGIGGFSCYAESDVLPGSGMSSSAAFEILIAEILNELYNDGKVSPEEQAKAGQFAENVYFGKASGLMDQMACSVGGFITIDFHHKDAPAVERVPFDFDHSGFRIILTDCRASHADLSDEYSRIPSEMKAAAGIFGQEVLSRVTLQEFLEKTPQVRKQCGDRAWLRAYHFLKETDRVQEEVKALEHNSMQEFLKLVIDSGNSSFEYLQNVYASSDPHHQSLSIGLALSQNLLEGRGAWRVHGGGFAGTIQAFVPEGLVETYVNAMEEAFGAGACYCLRIRNAGGYRLI